jgi:hypothetical protein
MCTMCWLYDYLNATVMIHFVFYFFKKKKKEEEEEEKKKRLSHHGPPDISIQGWVFRSLEKVSSRDKHKGLGI